MPTFSIAQIALLVIVTVAGIIDWKTKKIFNVITFPAAALGIVLNFMSGGWQAALVAVAGWIVAVAIMIVPDHVLMKKPKMYFGDAKLMAAIGAFVGPGGVLLTFLFFSIIYGLVAVTKTASVFPWQKMSMAMKTGVVTDDFLQDEKLQSALKSKIPLGPSIAVGTFLAIVLQKPTLDLLGFHDTTLFGLPMILSFAGYWF
ncbi:prepilin peptidase [Candidatus Obscuribacterales bacterium]|jgi:prepilin peptidase CpaA|nr:prepilin peptidase [Candidatus Obscuribacterales bacterium]